jgi:hypothetical protein
MIGMEQKCKKIYILQNNNNNIEMAPGAWRLGVVQHTSLSLAVVSMPLPCLDIHTGLKCLTLQFLPGWS